MTDTVRAQSSLPILITLAAATLTASLGISIAAVLLPTLTRSFAATVSEVQWVVLAYLTSVTITIVSVGRLGDLFGHRRLLIAGLIVFIAASVLSAMTPSLSLLITGRALQGLGGAILIALPMSIARDFVPTKRLGTAMGLLGTTSAAGTALGPSLGGVLLAMGNWRMAFWFLAGFAGVTLILSVTAITRDSERPTISFRELDFPGTIVLVIALATYALATSGGASHIPVPPAALFSAALFAIFLFGLVETRVASPLVPMKLLRDQRTSIGLLLNLLVSAIMMSTLVVGPFFLAYSLELNEAIIGLAMAVGPLVAALFGVPAGWVTDRLGADRAMTIGLVQTTVGLLCLAYLPGYFDVGGYLAALIMLTPGFQLFLAANNTAVLIHGAYEQRGRLSGLLGLSRNLGLMTGSLTGLELFHKKFDLPVEQVIHTEAPYYYRRDNLNQSEEQFVAHCATELEALIEREGADTIAAFIGEPVLGTGGIVPPPAGYWEAIQAVLKKHDILLVADEVVTGFGRLGTMFGSEHYGIEPDIITIAKGLTSAYAPLSGSIVSDKVWKVLEQGTDENGPIGHGWTYSAHPIGAAAGVANLKLIDELNLVSNAGEVGAYLNQAMAEALADHAHVGDVRGEGMLCAVELVKDKDSRTFFDAAGKIGPQVSAKLLEQSKIIARAMPQGDILGFAPPFCLTREEADQVVAGTVQAVKAVLG